MKKNKLNLMLIGLLISSCSSVDGNNLSKTETKRSPGDQKGIAPITLGSSYRASTIFFDFDSANVGTHSISKIENTTELIEDLDVDVKVILEGHADRIGEEDYNEDLALDRARNVKSHLVARGVPAEMIETQSYGEDVPLISDADTRKERRFNRRVTIKVMRKIPLQNQSFFRLTNRF